VTTEIQELVVGGVPVQVVRKKIKNLHLATYPPDGRVRIAVPLHVDDEAVRLAVASKMGWIRSQQAKYADQPRQSRREMVTGESHYVRGQRYRLDVIETGGKQGVRLRGRKLELTVRPGTSEEQRRELLNRWHREQLKNEIPKLIAKWEPHVGASVREWGVKKTLDGLLHVRRSSPLVLDRNLVEAESVAILSHRRAARMRRRR
jgi:predicted metal-dependent hydrolase